MVKVNVNANRPVPEFWLEECEYRERNYTPGCGGAYYWWCNKKNFQPNIYEDCANCKIPLNEGEK